MLLLRTGSLVAFGASGIGPGQPAQVLATGVKAPKIWAGVFTDQQATKGSAEYGTHCAGCHGSDLNGGADAGDPAPALVGDRFWRDWGEDDLSTLFTIMQKSMPRDAPSSLPEGTYIDLVAHILKVNGFPAGMTRLTRDALSTIQIVGKDGPGPVPDFALVEVVGCLSKGPDNVWLLTKASDLTRTRNPVISRDVDEHAKALGVGVVRLMSVFSQPDSYVNYKTEVKGFVTRAGGETRIEVASLEPRTPGCDK